MLKLDEGFESSKMSDNFNFFVLIWSDDAHTYSMWK